MTCDCRHKAWCNCGSDTHQSVLMPVSETWLLHTWDMTPSCVRHDSFTCETWLLHMWDMTRSYVRHDSFICETWLLRMWDMTLAHVQIAIQIICGTWLLHVWDMTPSCLRHDCSTCETWLLHMWDMTPSCVENMTPSCVRHRSCIYANCNSDHLWDITLLYVKHDSFMCGTWLIHMCDMALAHMQDSFTIPIISKHCRVASNVDFLQWHGLLQRVAVCCSVLQRVAVCCSVLQYATGRLRGVAKTRNPKHMRCNTLQHKAAH